MRTSPSAAYITAARLTPDQSSLLLMRSEMHFPAENVPSTTKRKFEIRHTPFTPCGGILIG
jgi:hypothetical protein